MRAMICLCAAALLLGAACSKTNDTTGDTDTTRPMDQPAEPETMPPPAEQPGATTEYPPPEPTDQPGDQAMPPDETTPPETAPETPPPPQ
jgi:hypothetical protein